MNHFWSLWIVLFTLITIVGILWILLANRKTTSSQYKGKEGEAKTGHEYDGIEEYDNPLPAWWMNMFIITIIFGLAYLIAYPGLGNFSGMLGWSQVKEYEKEMERAEEEFLTTYGTFPDKSVEGLAADPKAVKMGQRLFSNNCSVCHGADARGARGYPNLADGDWLWGGTGEQIKHSITLGRTGAMPAWGLPLGEERVVAVSRYVKALSEGQRDDPAVANGKMVFDMFCSACHGANGEGSIYLGAPNLSDAIWLYGGSVENISTSVRDGRFGKMPAHGEVLSEERIQLIGAYIYNLGKK